MRLKSALAVGAVSLGLLSSSLTVAGAADHSAPGTDVVAQAEGSDTPMSCCHGLRAIRRPTCGPPSMPGPPRPGATTTVRTASGTSVMSGIHTGDVDVTVALHESEPAPDSGGWQQDIAEISAHSVSGELTVCAMRDDLDEELPVLSFDGPGDYRNSGQSGAPSDPERFSCPAGLRT